MHTQARARGRRYSLRTPRRPAERPAEGRSPADGPMIHPRRGMSQMSDGQTPGNPDTPSGLRRAMEDRLTSLRQAEERLQREQAALQEQAKVVFAEREARLARRERELSKREAALAVSEGIAASHATAGSDAERAQLEELEAELARRAAELDAREGAIAEREATPSEPAPAGAEVDVDAAAAAKVAEIQEELAAAQGRLEAAQAAREGLGREGDGLVEQLRERGAIGSAELAELEARLNAREAELADREHRAKKVEK